MKDKAILVIDMPKNCGECEQVYYDEYYDCFCCSLTKKNIDHYIKNKSPDCPLFLLPSSISLKQYVDNAELNMDSMLACQYAQGWNEYRNEILKGDKNET